MILTSKTKKITLIVLGSFLLIGVLTVIFISPLTKHLIEKYDEKYTGRQITLDYAYANPFTGYIHMKNFRIHELNSDSIFLSANSLSINLSLLKLLSNTYEISMIELDHPIGKFKQDKSQFNIDDIIELLSPDNQTASSDKPAHFNILGIKINEGEFHYQETLIPINYFIKNLNFESTGIRWDRDTMAAKFSFKPGISTGDVKGEFTINLKLHDYKYAVDIQNLDLNIIEQYLNDVTNYGTFSAKLDAKVKSFGNFDDAEDLTTTGTISINDFHFGKNKKEDYLSFEKLALAINELSPKKHKYLFDSLLLDRPFFKYEKYDRLDNLQTMFGKDGSRLTAINSDQSRFNLILEIGKYVKILSRNFFQSYYQINRCEILNGDLKFNDYSLSEKFSAELSPFTIFADSIDKNNSRVNIYCKSEIKPYGNMNINVSINPKDTGDFDMQYKFEKLPAAFFNPYTITFTSFPLDRGTIEANGNWEVRKSEIKSSNHLVLIDPRVTKRLRNKDTKWMPLPLIMSFVRERGNVIDYEIPISGNLKDPNFHLRDAISDLLENIFVKPATIPYRMEVKNIENEIEKSHTMKWGMRSKILSSTQIEFIEKMVDFLVKNPNASITIIPQNYTLKEKEYILFFEAKKKYYLKTKSMNYETFNANDSERVNKMAIKDTFFVEYLNKFVNDSMVFTVQDKCARIIDESIVNKHLKQLNRDREKVFLSYFENKNTAKQIIFSNEEIVIPYNGFSFYKIKYDGEFPESLIKAYRQMSELNDEAPRKKFKSERKDKVPL